MTDRIAAVVVHFADADATERCVRSLLGAGLRVTVVDNSESYDGSRPATEVIRPGANLGYGAGANLGLRRAFEIAPLALLVNDDVTLEHPEGIDALVARLEEDPTIGIAGPLVLGPDGAVQPTVEEWPSAWRALTLGVRPYSRPAPAAETEVEAVNGVCMVIRGTAFLAANGFDERYFLYGEETDLCFRTSAAGYRTVFVPSASIVHHHRAGEVRGDAAEQIRVNYVRFCRDHRSILSTMLVALLFTTSALLRRRRPADLVRGFLGVLLPGRGAFVDRALVPLLLALWVVLLAFGSSYRQPVRHVGSLGKVAMVAVLIAIELPRIARNPRRYLAESGPGLLDAAAIAFVAFGLLSALWSMAPRQTLGYAVGTAAFFAAILLAPRRIARTPSGARALGLGLVSGTAVVVAANIVALVLWHPEAFTQSTNEHARFRGILENPDEVGAYVLLAPLVLWWTLEARRGRARAGPGRAGGVSLPGAVVTILLIGEIAYSGTRTALVLLVASLAVFLAAYLRGATGAVVSSGVSVACIALAVALVTSPAVREATLPGFIRPATLSTIGGRTEAWSGAIHLIGQRPLAGFGLGNELRSIHLYRDGGFRLYNECLGMPAAWLHAPLPDACETLVPHSRRLFDFSGDNAHQSFLGLGIQLGAVFLAAAALALVVAAVRLALLVRRRDGLEAACFAGVVTGLGLALVETYLFSPGNAVAGPFWLLLVIGLAAPARRRVPA